MTQYRADLLIDGESPEVFEKSPNLEQIAAATAKIRETWSDREYAKRAGEVIRPVEIQECEVIMADGKRAEAC